MGDHINKDGKFQSDKYPTCPAGKVPLSTGDKTAQDLLWKYAQRRRAVDAEFAADLETCLLADGYIPGADAARTAEVVREIVYSVAATEVLIHVARDIATRVAEQLAAPALPSGLLDDFQKIAAGVPTGGVEVEIPPVLSAGERGAVTIEIPADLVESVASAIQRLATVFRGDTGHSPEGVAVLQADADRLDDMAYRLLGGGQ